MQVLFYQIIDCQGNRVTAVAEENCSTIQMWGVDAQGQRQYFESEAYHLALWAEQHGFQYEDAQREFSAEEIFSIHPQTETYG